MAKLQKDGQLVRARSALLDRLDWRTVVFATSVAGAVGFAIAVRLAFGAHIREDAYITLRYAKHIAAGHGFVFNTGEHVLGTTTPLYALLVAGLAALGLAPVTAAVAVGIIADAAAMVVLGLLAARFLPRMAVLSALLVYAALSPIVSWALSGMETPLYVLLILSAVLTYAQGRMRLLGLCAALVVLTRPDGAIVVAVILLHALIRRRRGLLGAALVFAIVMLPWLAFASSYFGSPIPQSMVAKLQRDVSDPTLSLRNLVWYFSDTENRWFLPLTPLFLFGILRSKRDRALVVLIAWAFAYVAAFVISNRLVFPIIPFEWYFLPLLAPYSIGIGAGMEGIAAAAASVGRTRRPWLRTAVAIPVAGIFLLGYVGVLRYQHSELGRLVGVEKRYTVSWLPE